MKIIGKTGNGFIVQMTDGELGNVAGYNRLTGLREGGTEKISIGENFEVSHMFEKARDIIQAFESMKAQLLGVRDTVGAFIGKNALMEEASE
jgi:hypothetical protein